MTSSKKNLLVLCLAIMACLAVIVWIKVVNKGEVVISANLENYTVAISPLQGSFECKEKKCAIKIKPGEYKITLNRPGYFEKEYESKIAFWQSTKIDHRFIKIPQLSLRGDLSVPAFSENLEKTENNLKDKLLFLNEEKINSIEKFAEENQVKKIMLSPEGKAFYAVDEAGKLWLTKFDEEQTTVIDIDKNTVLSWKGDEGLVLLENDSESEKQVLKSWNTEAKEPEIISSFMAELKDSDLYTDRVGDWAVVTDKNEEETRVYLVDIKNKKKERILSLPNLANWKWAPGGRYAMYQVNSQSSDLPIIYVFDLINKSSRETRIPLGLELVNWTTEDEVVLFSNALLRNYLDSGESVGIEALAQRFTLSDTGLGSIDNDIILSYNVSNDEWRELSIKSNFALFVADIEVDLEEKKILVLSDGKIYELSLSEEADA